MDSYSESILSTFKCRQARELLLCLSYIYTNEKFGALGESRRSEQLMRRTLHLLYVHSRGFTLDWIYSAASPSLSILTVSTWKVSKRSMADADHNIPSSGRNIQTQSRVNRLVSSKIHSVSKTRTNLSVRPKSKVESAIHSKTALQLQTKTLNQKFQILSYFAQKALSTQ